MLLLPFGKRSSNQALHLAEQHVSGIAAPSVFLWRHVGHIDESLPRLSYGDDRRLRPCARTVRRLGRALVVGRSWSGGFDGRAFAGSAALTTSDTSSATACFRRAGAWCNACR
jgi:hypothetical protein